MVKLNQAFGQQPNQSQQASFQQANSTQQQASFPSQEPSQPASQAKGLFQIPPALLQWIPLIPFVLEQATGQKIPPMGGTIAEIQASIQQIQFSLSQIFNSQQQLWTKLESLENNASSQLTNLATQVQSIQSLRLTHSKEHKALEYNAPNPRLPDPETY